MIPNRRNLKAQFGITPNRASRNEDGACCPPFRRLPVVAFSWVAVLCSLALGGCGGGTEVPKPGPTVSALSPTSAIEGTGPLILLVSGSNFTASSSVQWNGSDRKTMFVSASELQAQIGESDVAFATLSAITVVNPDSGVTSTAAMFTVTNPIPVVISLNPSSVVYLTASALELTLNGSGFVPSSVVFWNKTSLPTAYLSATQLTAVVPGTALTAIATVSITVVQPAPGGGTSLPQMFTIAGPVAYSIAEIQQAANDLAWDSSSGLIYVSVPSTAAAYGNSIAALDPDAGVIVASQYTGSEPSRLALSDDNQFLYVGLNGASSVRRLTLPSLAQSVEYSLGASMYYGGYFALDLVVAPGAAHTSAVTLGANVVPAAQGGVIIFDDAIARPNEVGGFNNGYNSLQWGVDATHLYAANNETTNFDFYILSVSASGVSEATDYQGAIHHSNDFVGRIHYARGNQLVYVDDGIVLDPAVGLPRGAFATAGLMVPDSSVSRAFFLTSPLSGSPEISIQVFDLTHFTPIAIIPLPDVKGNPLQLIRWGPNGLAFCTDAGYLYLLTGGFVDGSG